MQAQFVSLHDCQGNLFLRPQLLSVELNHRKLIFVHSFLENAINGAKILQGSVCHINLTSTKYNRWEATNGCSPGLETGDQRYVL